MREVFFQLRSQKTGCPYLNKCTQFQVAEINKKFECFAFLEMGACDLQQILKIRVKEKLYYSNTEILITFKQLALGFAAIEQQGMAHRDIKPANVLYSFKKKIYQIADFGEGLLLKPGLMATRVAGSPAYMAPELKKLYRAKVYDSPPYNIIRADIYSLGVMIFEMITFERRPTTQKIHALSCSPLIKKLLLNCLIDRVYNSFCSIVSEITLSENVETSDARLVQKHLLPPEPTPLEKLKIMRENAEGYNRIH